MLKASAEQPLCLRVVLPKKVVAVHLIGAETESWGNCTHASSTHLKNMHSEALRDLHSRCKLSYSSGAFQKHRYWDVECKSLRHQRGLGQPKELRMSTIVASHSSIRRISIMTLCDPGTFRKRSELLLQEVHRLRTKEARNIWYPSVLEASLRQPSHCRVYPAA